MRKIIQRRKLARLFAKCYRLGLDDKRISVFDACQRIKGSQRELSDANDLFAAWETCRIMRANDTYEDVLLFCEIYLRPSSTATALALKKYYDERTVYRRLERVERQYRLIRKGLDK